MKASELRVGNFVQIVENDIDYLKPGEIIKWDLMYFASLDKGYSNEECFSGVPITEEWLLKFGLTKPDKRDCFIKKRLQIWKQMCFLIEEDTMRAHWIPVKLEFVHQLQNLFFALTGEELTA